MPRGKKRQPQRKNGWQEPLWNLEIFILFALILLHINKIIVKISYERNIIGTKIGIFGDSSVFTFLLISFLALGCTQSVSQRWFLHYRPLEFVRLLREGSWFDSGCTDGEYMVNFSGRYRELHGVTVRTDTPEHFMDDLKKYGYIKGWEARSFIVTFPAGSFISGGDFFLFSRYLISAVSCFPEAGFTTSFLNHFFLFSYCYQRIVVLLHTIPAISGRIPGSRRTAICHIFCRHWLFMSIYDYNWQGIPSYIYSFFLCGVGRQSATGNVRLTKHPVITWN